MEMITKVFEPHQFSPELLNSVTTHLVQSPNLDVFLMNSYHCEKEPKATRPLASGFTIGTGYFLGGLLPLIPYFFHLTVQEALVRSFVVMVIALFVFGYGTVCADKGWKGRQNYWAGFLGGLQMTLVGCCAAGSAMLAMVAVKWVSPEGQTGSG